ncbi:unnamed protein product [Blepharisma stoltei]|uniref:Uncharacterized protein n=1 Tax=Blepharisma stoltei TaxID=1481888 RepID=A0AAU9IT65_9CILI|nr:unnamed protein product [Blepharisma stoltei]
MSKLEQAYQEENKSLREENRIIRNNLPKLTNIIQGHNPSVILTGNMHQEVESMLSIIQKQRELIEQLESQLEQSQNNYENVLEQSLVLARKAAREPVHPTSYLQEMVEREEAKVRELEDVLKDKTSKTARELAHLKYTEVEQTAEMSTRSVVATPTVRSPSISMLGNKQEAFAKKKQSRF